MSLTNNLEHQLQPIASLLIRAPSFQRCLQAQLSEFHTPAELSASQLRAVAPAIELDIPSQVAEVKNAKSKVRQSFLRLLCTKGTLEMIKPFLNCGFNLDECGPSDDKTYIRAAARSGNVDIVAALAETGASLNTYYPWMSENETLPASLQLTISWKGGTQ